jgi:hypothetical protein
MTLLSTMARPERRKMLPRVRGVLPVPPPSYPSYPEYIPAPLGTPGWEHRRPVAAVARRGQALFLTTALLHGGQHNEDAAPRKALTLSYTAAGVSCGCPGQPALEAKEEFFQRARAVVSPSRAHIVPSSCIHFNSGDYTTHWPETFMPGADGPKL